jgi:hypothetical protein
MEYKAPAELSKQSAAVWRGVVPRRAKTAERMLLIKTALQALDRAAEVTAKIKEQGLTIENPSTGAIRANPLVKIEKELRQQFASIWLGMDLDWHAVIDGGNEPYIYGGDEKQKSIKAEHENNLAINEAAVKEFLKVNNDA